MVAQAPVWARIGCLRVVVRIAGARRLAVRGHFSLISGCGPSTALRVGCRFVLS